MVRPKIILLFLANKVPQKIKCQIIWQFSKWSDRPVWSYLNTEVHRNFYYYVGLSMYGIIYIIIFSWKGVFPWDHNLDVLWQIATNVRKDHSVAHTAAVWMDLVTTLVIVTLDFKCLQTSIVKVRYYYYYLDKEDLHFVKYMQHLIPLSFNFTFTKLFFFLFLRTIFCAPMRCNRKKIAICVADIDECNLGLDTCDLRATCENINGSYICECTEGYVGNGHSCRRKSRFYFSRVQHVLLPPAYVVCGKVMFSVLFVCQSVSLSVQLYPIIFGGVPCDLSHDALG